MTDQGRTPPAGDAEYRALLAELSTPPAHEAVDWDALHARIEAAAALPLARLRAADAAARPSAGEGAWWEFAARRARALLPLAVAASLAMFAYVQRHPVDLSETVAMDAGDAYAAAVVGAASSSHVTSLLVAAAGDAEPVSTASAR